MCTYVQNNINVRKVNSLQMLMSSIFTNTTMDIVNKIVSLVTPTHSLISIIIINDGTYPTTVKHYNINIVKNKINME